MDLDTLSPEQYMEQMRNGNTRRNDETAVKTFERVMAELSKKTGEVYESLEEATGDRLPFLLSKYLQAAKKVDGSVYASGTIITLFNGICSFLCRRDHEKVDVKTDVRFREVRDMLSLQTGLSAAAGRGTGCASKRPITPAHLGLAIQAGTVGRGSPKALITSVHLGAVLGWGCRTGAECHMITNSDLIFGPNDSKHGVPEWIELSERITKTRSGNPGDERELKPRIFPDHKFPHLCYVRTLLEYQRRKKIQQKNPEAPFFLNVLAAAAKSPAQYNYWYVGTGQPGSGIMGIHTLEGLITEALEGAGVDCKTEKYSAISLRKSLMQSGVNCLVPDLHLSRLAGHKSLASKQKYVNSAGTHHKTSGRVIQRNMFLQMNDGYVEEMKKVEAEEKRTGAVSDQDGESRDEDGSRSRSRDRKRTGSSRSRSRDRTRTVRSHSRSRDRKRTGSSRSRSRDRKRTGSSHSRGRDMTRTVKSCSSSRDRKRTGNRGNSRNRTGSSQSRSRDRKRTHRSRSKDRERTVRSPNRSGAEKRTDR